MSAFRATIDVLRLTAFVGLALGIALGSAQANTTDNKPSKFYEDALVRYNDKDYKGALLQLRNELEVNPDNLPARVLAGQIMLQAGLGAGAEQQFRLARKGGADDDLIVEPLGRAYLQQNKLKELFEEVRPGNRPPRIEAPIRLLLGQAHLNRGERLDAKIRFQETIELDERNVEALLGLARIAQIETRIEDATELNRRALEIAPHESEPWFFKGKLERAAGNREAAVANFSRAIELDEDDIEARLNRAASLIELRRFDEALPDVEKAKEETPYDPRASFLYSAILSQRGDARQAQEALQNAALNIDRIDPHVRMSDPSIMFAAGVVAFAQGKIEDAYVYLNAYHEQIPHNPAARKIFARVLMARGADRRALDLLEPMLRSQPNDGELHSLVGDAYLRLGRNSEAAVHLERAVALTPKSGGLQTRLGLSRLAAGMEREGLDALNNALAQASEARRAAMILSVSHLRAGRNKDALETAERLMKLHGEDPYSLNLAGVALMRLERDQEARQRFERALAIDAKYKPARENLATLAVNEGDEAEARARYYALLRDYPDDPAAMVALSRIAEATGKIEEAIEWLNEARKRDIKSLDPQLRLVHLHLRQNQSALALEILTPLEDEHPRSLDLLIAKGMAEAQSGDVGKALLTYRKAANIAAQTAPALLRLAERQIGIGDRQGARWSLESAMKLAPEDIKVLSAMAELETEAGATEKALALADKLEAAIGDTDAADTLRGDILMSAGRYPDAASAYRRVFDRAPNNNLAIRLHRALMSAGKVGEALSVLETWSKAHPTDIGLFKELAGAYAGVGNLRKAIEKLETVYRAMPRDASVANNLAWLYHSVGDPKARAAAEYAYNLDPQSPNVLDTYGWILVQEGEAQHGLQLLREAFTRSSATVEIRYHIAVALAKLGRTDEAIRELQQALQAGRQFAGAEDARALLARLERGG